MMKHFIIFIISICSLLFATTSFAADKGEVFFENLQDGQTVSSPINVKFGIKGMHVVPAGTDEPMSGHHHLLVDTNLPNMSEPIPADDNHIHFGGGQLETTIVLAPGKHTLQLLLGNWSHIPHKRPVKSKKITITVE
jgi:hypothetical protein